jgi:fumarate reductase subunit D
MWPWLLLPLVALTLFFALHRVKHAPAHHAIHADESVERASSEAGESP